ncbi:MAG: hypothetical protein AAGF32_03415 [Pseudomonadota bacterium]
MQGIKTNELEKDEAGVAHAAQMAGEAALAEGAHPSTAILGLAHAMAILVEAYVPRERQQRTLKMLGAEAKRTLSNARARRAAQADQTKREEQ